MTSFLILLTVLAVILKLSGILVSSWIVIFAPILVYISLYTIMFVVMLGAVYSFTGSFKFLKRQLKEK